jgi:hypothetical protein
VRRSSNLFMLNWSTHKPADVPVVLNAIAVAYMNSRRQREMSVYDANLQLFRDQLTTTQRELRNTDGEIHQLILASGLTTLDDTRWSAQFHQLQGLLDRAAELSTSLNIAQSGLNLVRQQIEGRIQPNPDDRVIAERDPTLQNFSQSLEYQKAQFRELSEERMPGDQMLLDMERSVRTSEAQFEAKVQEVMIRNLQAKASEMEIAVKRFLSAIEENAREQDRLNVTLKDLTTKQSDYEALKSQRDFLQEQRQADMQLINELQMMRTRIDATRVRLAQLSFTPRAPSVPQPQVIIPLGALVLIGLTVGLIFLRELVDQRVKSPSDLAVLPGARVLGSLPDASEDPTRIVAPELVVRRQPNSVLAESYRQAATAILPEMAHAEAQTLLRWAVCRKPERRRWRPISPPPRPPAARACCSSTRTSGAPASPRSWALPKTRRAWAMCSAMSPASTKPSTTSAKASASCPPAPPATASSSASTTASSMACSPTCAAAST